MVLPEGTVKLLDFGLAKLVASPRSPCWLLPNPLIYKSPGRHGRQSIRELPSALGVVLYEMVTGRLPFGGEYEQAVIYSILNEPPRPLEGAGAFPSQLSEVIERTLAKDPAERYQTAEELENDLREHRWNYWPEVKRLFKRGNDLKRRGDAEGVFLASKLQAAGRYDEAEAMIRKVLEHDPDHPTANQILGEIYLVGRRNLAALPLFQKVFEATHDSRAANGLGLTYLKLERMPEAIKIFHEAYRLQPDPITARNLAECYEKVGQQDEAQRWYALALAGFDRLLIRGGSRSTYLLYVRSFCAAKLGRIDEAFENIREAMRLEQQLLTSLDFPQLSRLELRNERTVCYERNERTEPTKLGRIGEAFGRLQPDRSHFALPDGADPCDRKPLGRGLLLYLAGHSKRISTGGIPRRYRLSFLPERPQVPSDRGARGPLIRREPYLPESDLSSPRLPWSRPISSWT